MTERDVKPAARAKRAGKIHPFIKKVTFQPKASKADLKIFVMKNWGLSTESLKLRAKEELGAASDEVHDIVMELMVVR